MNGLRTKGIFASFTRRDSMARKAVALVAVLTFTFPLPAFPQQIIIDGMTNTTLTVRDNITDVTTATVRGANAFNSFSKFDVYQGNVVNLHIPGSAVNLLNLVHGQASNIDGILNAYKDGRIGGNVFFANSYGFLIGSTGAVNVGSLTVMTPTRGFMDNFFDSPGNPSLSATAMMLNGTAPLDPNGLISIRGKINAQNRISLSAGTVQNSGVITSGADFTGKPFEFSDLVNVNGLESGSEIAVTASGIEIRASGDVVNTGTVAADGATGRNAGDIRITAGNDVILNDGTLLSARGHGEGSAGGRITVFADRNAEMRGAATMDARGGEISGNGGFIELSAKEKVLLEGGIFKTSAQSGTVGSVLIDPDELIIGVNQRTDDGLTTDFVNFSHGGDITLTADESITVNPGVIISTRNIGNTVADTAANHLTAQSQGNSGNISMTAPQITLNSGAMLLAHAINGMNAQGENITNFQAGNITLTATDTATSITPVVHIKNSNARIALNGATLMGNNVKLSATAESAKLFDDSNEATEVALGIFEGLLTPGGAAISNSTAEINLGTGTTISANNLNLDAKAKSEAKLETSGMLLSVAYGESNPTAKVIVNNGVTINTTNDLKISSTAESTLDIKAKPFMLGLVKPEISPDVTVAVGSSTIEATSQISSGASLTAGGNMDIKAKMTKSQNVSASAGAYEDGSVGAAVAVSLSTSTVNAIAEGTINAGKNLAVRADSETTKNNAAAKAAVGGLTTPMKVVTGTGLYNKTSGWFSKNKPSTDARSGNTSSLALSAAVVYSEHTNNATARIGEPAESYNPDHSTSVTSQTGGVEVAALIKDAFTTKATSSIDSDLIGDKNPKGNTKENSVSAAVAIGRFTNNATATIGKNAIVNARKEVTVDAATRIPYDLSTINWDELNGIKDIIDNNLASALGEIVTSWAQSGAKGTKTAIAGAVNDLSVTNTSNAVIDANAQVHLDNAFIPNLAFANILQDGKITFTAPHKLNSGDKVTYNADTAELFQGLQQGKIYYAIVDSPTVIRLAESREQATADTPQAIALTPQSAAAGTTHGFSVNQAVTVSATNEIDSVNLSGNFKTFPIPGPGTGSGEAGVGGAYLGVRYNNAANARIMAGASIQADSVAVNSATKTRTIAIAESGGSGGTYAINGAFSLLKTTNTTLAQIDDGATLDIRNGIIDDNGNGLIDTAETSSVHVNASDTSKIFNIGGGIAKGKSVGIGVTVSINEITRDTEALIGNRLNETDETTGHVNSDGNVRVNAANDGVISSWSLAAAVATQDLKKYDWPEDGINPQSAKGKEKLAAFLDSKMKNPKPQYGLGISGDVSVNLVADTAKAYVKDAEIGKASALTVKATNDSEIDAVAGSATFTKADGTSVGLAGSVTWNEITNTTKAYVDHSNLGVTGDVGLTADSTGTIRTIAASGSGAVSRVSDSGVGVAGSLAYSYVDNDTAAYINNSDVSSDTNIARNISISAIDNATIWSVAGAGSYGGKAGIGASIAVNRMENSTEAYAKDSDLAATGNILISAAEESEILSVSAAIGAAKNGMAVAASATGNDLANTTTAYISGKKTDGIIANNNISLAATDNADILSVTGNIAIAKGSGGIGGAGLGISASVTVTDNRVESYIGSGSTVTAKGLGGPIVVYTGDLDADGNRLTENMKGVAVTATSYEDILSVAAGGAFAEELAIEGSAAVHVLKETTLAHIDGGATVTAGNPGTDGQLSGTEQGVTVRAADTTDILGIAGAVMGSLKGGVGAGADVGVIGKTTQASIGNNANVMATQDIRVQATSSEDINSIAGTIAVGKDWAFGGAASVYVLTNTTQAYIEGGDTSTTSIHADGSILVAAGNSTEIDSIAGSGVFGMSAGIGASATTAVIGKTTEAYIGKNATVEADGKRAAIDAATGRFTTRSENNTGDAYGIDSSDTSHLNLNTTVDTSATSAAETTKMKGLAVTATAKDDVSSIAASGGGSGTVAINLAGSVNVIGNNTSASIADGAKVNTDQTSAGDSQSVTVAAGTDFRHLGIGAAVSIGGQVGLGPAAEVTVVDNNTYAYIGKGAQVNAKEDVEVIARSSQDILSITGAGALGIGAVGLAGSVSVISIDNDTFAYLGDRATGSGQGTTVNAGGNIVVSAKDATETDIVAGSVAGGLVGIGGAVGVTLIEKDTRAFIGSNAEVNAKANSARTATAYSALDDQGTFSMTNVKGVTVQAESSEDFSTITGAFAGGFAGLAGAVVVNTIESDTTAFIGNSAKVNQDRTGVNSDQSVQVTAVNDVTDFAVSGSIAGGAVGISGGLGFHTIKNNTNAYLGNGATVTAGQDIGVTALADKGTDTYSVSAAGGFVGLGGGVTIMTIGDPPDNSTAATLAAKGGNSGYSDPSSYAQSQARNNFMSGATSDSYGMGDAKARTATATSSVKVSPTAVPAGTAAFIGRSATIDAGRDIRINAKERIDAAMISGAVAAGIAGLGGGVGIASVRSQVKAYIDNDEDAPIPGSSISASRNIDVSATLTETTLDQAFAGGLSAFVSLSGAVSYVNNDYVVDAHIGKGVSINKAGTVAVTANTSTDNTAEGLEAAISALGIGAGVSWAEVDSDGSTLAYLDDNVRIGRSNGTTVDYLTVKASSSNSGSAKSKHLAGGIVAGGYNKSDTSINPTVTAAIGSNALITVQQDLTVGARADVESTAATWGGAFGGVAVGVGNAAASATPTVSAFIAGGTLSDIYAGDNISIKAYGNHDWFGTEQAKTISAENDATAGSIFLSDSSPTANTTGTWTVSAAIGADADLEAQGDLQVLAKSYTGEVKSDVDGNAYSLGALGNNASTTTVTHTVNASIGKDAAISADAVSVNASGKSNGYATTFGGVGGIIAGASASSTTNVTNTVNAWLAGNGDTAALIEATRDITVSSTSTALFNSHVGTTAYGFVGNNGARITNTVTSTANAYIGTDANVHAQEDLLVTAANNITKSNIGDNLNAGAGGFWGGPAGDSTTTITATSTAYLAGNSSGGTSGKIKADHDVTVAATNDIFAFDKGTLSAGGAIAVAVVNDTITATTAATAYIGENAAVEGGNDVTVASRTKANVEAVTYTEGFGLGASADGTAVVTVTANNDANVAANAAVAAGNDINILAGKDADGWQNSLRARAEARSFSAGGIPLSSVAGHATLNNYNDVLVAGGANLEAGRDINLGALRGSEFVEGFARAKLRTYLLFGIPITWYSDGSRISDPHWSNTVTVNGAAESGLNRHRILHINSLEQVSSDSSIRPTLIRNIDGVTELDAKIADLDERIAQEQDNNVKILLSQDKARYEASRAEILAKRTDATNPDPFYGFFDRFILPDTRVGSGDINITGSLKGNGTLKVPGNDFKIEIFNDSLAHLELHDLDIPAETNGSVTLNNRTIASHDSVMIVAGENLGKRIIVENRYDPDAPGANENAAADLVLKGNITNHAGSVDITNLSGSIESLGNVMGDEVTIFARREFNQNYIPGVWNAPDSLISGSNVNISGQILNIKGTIQSGIPYRTITIPDFNPATDLVTKGNVRNVIPTTGDSNITAVWDAERNCIQLYSVKVTGGNITLAGEIVSTGGGRLKVIDGYGEIDVRNNSSRDMVINKLDVGRRVNGMIKITDTGKLDANGNPLVTEIRGAADGNLDVVQYRIRWDDQDGKVKVVDNSRTSTPVAGRLTTYEPRPGARFIDRNGFVLSNHDSASQSLMNFLCFFGICGVAADNPINVEFTGSTTPRIAVTNTTAANIYLNSDILNRDGDVSIRNDGGGIYSLNKASEIWGRNIALSAPTSDIGNADQAVRIDTRGGVLRADALGSVNIEEVDGNLTLDSVSTAGDTWLTAAGSILGLPGSTPTITGRDITLSATSGGIGTADNSLRSDSLDGVMTADALDGIYLTETSGGMKIKTVTSIRGDVVLKAEGAIEDYNFGSGRDDDTLSRLDTAINDLGLVDTEKVQAAIAAYKKQKKDEYRAAHRISNNGTPYEPGDDTYDSSYNPAWEYALTESEQRAFAESVWKADELVNAKNIATLPGSVLAKEEPNVSGRNVTIITNAGVGSYGGKEIISQADIASGNITPEQMLLLARAEKGEISYNGTDVVISRDKDFNVQASGTVNIQARDHIYLGGGAAALSLNVSRTGGTAEVTDADISDRLTVAADTILMRNIAHTGSGAPLHADLRGGSTIMAGQTLFNAASTAGVVFDHLFADHATITVAADNLNLLDSTIGSRSDISNSRYHAIVDNLDRRIQPCDLQLYSTAPFSLRFMAERQFETTAFVIAYDPDFTVNGFGTENSVAGMANKMFWIGRHQEDMSYNPAGPGLYPWQRSATPSGHDVITIQPGSVGHGDPMSPLRLEDTDVVYE